MLELGAKQRRPVNGWMIYSLVLTGLVAFFAFGPRVLMEPGREKSIGAVEQVLKAAGKRDYDGMAKFASPQAVAFMRERDAKWGRVVRFSYEDSLVQVGGTPAEVTYRVWRERKNVRETFGCNGDRVLSGFVTWSEAEE